MKISELLKNNDRFVSLEFFPPKEEKLWPSFFGEVEKLKRINPLFASVTYGAGGSTRQNSLEIVTRLKQEYDIEPMAHLTCIGATNEQLHSFVKSLESSGIKNILALGGDPPTNDENFNANGGDFVYASDLVQFLKANYPETSIGVAGYPEKHPKAETIEKDLGYLKQKIDFGGDFVITQLFFDNDLYFNFVKKARDIGIDKPIIPGVMPVFNLKLTNKITSMCGATIPASLLADLERAEEKGSNATEKVGIEYAQKQAQDLLDRGAPGVHLYTLNKAGACLEIVDSLRL